MSYTGFHELHEIIYTLCIHPEGKVYTKIREVKQFVQGHTAEYIKPVYCHPAYLTYVQSTS